MCQSFSCFVVAAFATFLGMFFPWKDSVLQGMLTYVLPGWEISTILCWAAVIFVILGVFSLIPWKGKKGYTGGIMGEIGGEETVYMSNAKIPSPTRVAPSGIIRQQDLDGIYDTITPSHPWEG